MSFLQNKENSYETSIDNGPDENPFQYKRIPHYERSATFGFNDDTLGRLNEINRE
jgi:hypothetical protein